jgi:hypothetical protein
MSMGGEGLLAFVRKGNMPGGTLYRQAEMRESFGATWKDADLGDWRVNVRPALA